jgi:hypothetical protein
MRTEEARISSEAALTRPAVETADLDRQVAVGQAPHGADGHAQRTDDGADDISRQQAAQNQGQRRRAHKGGVRSPARYGKSLR